MICKIAPCLRGEGESTDRNDWEFLLASKSYRGGKKKKTSSSRNSFTRLVMNVVISEFEV